MILQKTCLEVMKVWMSVSAVDEERVGWSRTKL